MNHMFDEMETAFYKHEFQRVGLQAGLLFEAVTRHLFEHACAHHATLLANRGVSPREPWTLNSARNCLTEPVLLVLADAFPAFGDEAVRSEFRHVLAQVSPLRNRSEAHYHRPPLTATDAAWLRKEVAHWLPLLGFLPQRAPERASRHAAATDLERIVVEQLASWDAGRPFVVEVLGLTMHKGWPALRFLAERVAVARPGVKLRLDVTMLDPEWPALGELKAAWPTDARQTAATIQAECRAGLPHVESVRVRTIEFVPPLHGFRINRQTALASLSSPYTDCVDPRRLDYVQVFDGGDAAAHALWRQFDLVWRAADQRTKRTLVTSPGADAEGADGVQASAWN